MTIYQVYDFAKKHGVITPIFDASIRSGLRSMGIDDTADPYAYFRTSRGEYELRSALYNAPLIGGFMRHRENMQRMDAGLKMYGLGYDDIHYVGSTLGADGSANSYLGYLSSNIGELYK